MIKAVLEHLLTDDLAFSRAVESQELVVDRKKFIYVTHQALYGAVENYKPYVNVLMQTLKLFSDKHLNERLVGGKKKFWWRLDLDFVNRMCYGRVWPVLESSRGMSRAKYLKDLAKERSLARKK